MLAAYLGRGLKAGLVGGLAYGLFVALVGNRFVAAAEHYEAGHGPEHEAGVALATTTASVGAGVLWGLLLGVVAFGIAYYVFEPAIPGARDTKSYLLGAVGFVTVSGAPWLVFPPQPPGTEQALSPDTRLVWYAGLMVTGALACGLAGFAYARVPSRYGRPRALGAAALPFALLAVPILAAPANPAAVPAPEPLVTAFRATVVFGQAVLWAVLAAAHAWFVRRETDTPSRLGAADAERAAAIDA